MSYLDDYLFIVQFIILCRLITSKDVVYGVVWRLNKDVGWYAS